MADGRVIVRDVNGNEVPETEMQRSIKVSWQSMGNQWRDYLETVVNGTVETVPIFSIDLNRFTSGYNRVKILTYGERVSNQ